MTINGVLELKAVLVACEDGRYKGFCVACGQEKDGVEPDAREYVCDGCDAHQVCGAEELILMYAEHAFA